MEADADEVAFEMDEEMDSPAQESMQTPLALPGSSAKARSSPTKGTSQYQPQSPSKQKSHSQLRQSSQPTLPITVREYVEPVFVIDYDVVDGIE